MQNYVQPGDAIAVAFPYQRNTGQPLQVGAALFGVAKDTVASGSTGVMWREGVFSSLPKGTGTGDVTAIGDRLFWDNTNKVLTKTSTGNLAVGIALSVAAATGTTVDALIEPSTPAGT